MTGGPEADRLAIEYLSVLDLPTIEFVHLAADLGCRAVSLGSPALEVPNAELRRVLADRGVTVSLAEGCVVVPDLDVSRYAPMLESFAALDVPRVNTLSFDRDRARSIDQFAALASLAGEVGMAVTIETSRGFVPTDLAEMVAVQHAIGRADVRLLIDTMHVVRSGAGPAEIAALDPGIIGYVQLCDVPRRSTRELSYLDEAMYDRKAPGDGELPLHEILAAVPRDVVVGLEVPNRTASATRDGLVEHLRRSVAAARALLAGP